MIIKAKKTVEIKELVEFANKLLAMEQSELVNKGYKDGICTMIEHAMRKAKSYNGFLFNDVNDCEYNTFGHVSREYFLKD